MSKSKQFDGQVLVSIEDCRIAAGILSGTSQAWHNLAAWHNERGSVDKTADCDRQAKEIQAVSDRLWAAAHP